MTDSSTAIDGAAGDAVGGTSLSLLDLARHRDEEGWRRLTFLYSPLVFHWCLSARLSRHDAEEVLQDVFLSVSANLSRFTRRPGSGGFRGWLRVITRNKLNDHFRRSRLRPEPVGQLIDAFPADDPDQEAEERVVHHRALELLRGEFEPGTWRAFWLVCVDGRDPADAAAECGLTRNAVYLAKSRVLRRLRSELGDLLG